MADTRYGPSSCPTCERGIWGRLAAVHNRPALRRGTLQAEYEGVVKWRVRTESASAKTIRAGFLVVIIRLSCCC
jgi:hypothetical protein